MGESAKILNPEKKVLLPDPAADCAMAHMADVEKIRAMRNRYPDLAVVCYINSTAKLKQYADVCVTSANAVKVVKALPNKHIYFIPDQHLGSFVAAQVPEKEVTELADYVGSTSGIIRAVAEDEAKTCLIGTELGVLYELKKQNPEKEFYPLQAEQCCYDMKKVTLKKVRDCLRDETNEVYVDREVSEKANRAMELMLQLAK